jgi:sugar lactone lactonase YvrE
MIGRTVARSFATVAIAALAAIAAPQAASALMTAPPGGSGGAEDLIALPDGFQPEGIAVGPGGTAYVGSLADGDVYVVDLRTGEELRTLEGPGTPSVGLKVDRHDRLFIAGGPTGGARVVDAATGEVLASYEFTAAPSFVNDVVLTRSGAWFTDSLQAQLYFVPLSPSGELADPSEFVTLPLTGEWMQQGGFNANGIAETPDHRALLVIQSNTGTLFRVDPETGEATAVDLGGATLPNGDGLLVVGRTLYVVQNVLDTVAVVRLDAQGTSGELVDALTSPEFQVPTTVARFGDGLFLPNARFGTPPTPETEYSVVRIDRR